MSERDVSSAALLADPSASAGAGAGYATLADYWAEAAPDPNSRAIKACYVGPDAAERLSAYAQVHCGKIAHLVLDRNTLAAVGDSVHVTLESDGKLLGETCFGAQTLDATVELGEDVLEDACDADFLVAIGSGTICDLAKYAGDKLGRPVLLYPTAASMNGYTSGIVALKVNGLKRTLPCTPAAGIFADPEVAATAPKRLVAAGIADFLSKCSSATDWRVGHALRGGYYTDEPRKLFVGTTERVLCAAQRIGRGETAAYGTVLDALMLSGYSMVLAGSSAPASGGEHLISHYLDMKAALYGTEHDLHGAQVGVATLECLRLWERVLALDPDAIDADACAAAQPSDEQIGTWINEDWPEAVAAEVRAQWAEKRLDADGVKRELDLFRAKLAREREAWSTDLLPAAVVEKAIRAVGGPVTPEELDAPVAEFRNALRRARFIRNRFTVLDLAAELGI